MKRNQFLFFALRYSRTCFKHLNFLEPEELFVLLTFGGDTKNNGIFDSKNLKPQ